MIRIPCEILKVVVQSFISPFAVPFVGISPHIFIDEHCLPFSYLACNWTILLVVVFKYL